MKKTLASLAVSALAIMPAFADVSGSWRSEANESGASISVQIYGCGQAACGKVTQIHNSSDLSAMDKVMIKDMVTSDGVNFSGGQIYAPDEEKWYLAKMQLLDNNNLKVSGCVLGGVICRSQVWTRE